MSEVLDIWKLRTHPFRQPTDAAGNPLPEDALFSSLNPLKDNRLVNLYFNIYDWDKSKLIRGLNRDSATALDQFPNETKLKESKGILILVSGEKAAGRESMRNLILHKIKLENHGKDPLVVTVKLDGLAQNDNITLIARAFNRHYERDGNKKPTFKYLTDLYKSETEAKSSGSDSIYSNLFFEFYESIKDYFDRPLVLILSGGDHYDTWETVYNSTRDLFKYIIVVTNNERDADSCIKHLSEASVAHIKARRLDLAKARDYLQERLSQERVAELAANFPLAPFGDEALDALFGPGSQPDPNTSPQLTIGRLNKILSQALDLHLSEVLKIAEEKNKSLTELDLQETLISPDTILTAIKEV